MPRIVCFHNPHEVNGYLSNWYMSDFVVNGVKFSSGEQYMMYSKSQLFGDTTCTKKILAASDVAEIKALGRTDAIWNGRKQLLIYKGLLEKFRCNPKLKNQLLATGDAVLAECAVKDRIWGIGLSMSDPRNQYMSEWRGQNLLGFTLMEVRETLRT